MNNNFLYRYFLYKDLIINNNLIGGKKIKKIKRMNNYSKSLSEPWFSLIKLGLKTVEGRLNMGEFSKFKINDIIEWTNDNFNKRRIRTKITNITNYNTFEEYLKDKGLNKCLPSMDTIEDGLSVYYKYYKKEDEEQYGIIAIEFEII